MHIGQLTTIEDYVWVYPYVVTTNDPYPPMANLVGVTLKKYSQVATGSIVMPGKIVGENALVGAMTLVNKDVLEERVVVGIPGKDRGSVRDLEDNNHKKIYPWRDHLKGFRGYPWQKKGV